MKKRMFASALLTFAMLLCGCNGKKYDDPIPDFEDFDSPYTDKLPPKAEDGSIFHAFCWTYKDIENNLEAIKDAGFRNIQISPVQQPKGGGGAWWLYYQPLSFSIADNSKLGTKTELESMCTKAEQLGMSVIADIVFNHMANIGDEVLEPDGTPKVSPNVAQYEPEIYNNRNEAVDAHIGVTFHHNPHAQGSGAETQVYPWGGLPDLNTGNEYVQGRCYSLLKECIDVGIDGFRFDAAKHIETPDDPQYASNFWPNTLGKAKTYYKEKTGNDLFAYGEILGSPEGRDLDVYTKMMDICDDGYISNVYAGNSSKDAQKVVNTSYKADADKVITWVESHDNFCNKDGIDANGPISDKKLVRCWAIVGSRKGSHPLYFARPAYADGDPSAATVGVIGDYYWQNELVATVNRFRNRFYNAEEELSASNAVAVVERYSATDAGAVLDNTDYNTSDKEVEFKHLEDGNYYDTITGNKVFVYKGKAKVTFNEMNIMVLVKTHVSGRPNIIFPTRDGVYAGNKNIQVTVENAETASYQIDNGSPVSFSGKTSIKLPSQEGYHTLKITAKNGEFTAIREGKYQSIALVPGYFNVVNFNMDNFDNYDVYIWHWTPGAWTKVTASYIQGDLLLFDTTGWTGFLLALFQKGFVPHTQDDFEDSHFVKQTSDLNISLGYFDATGF